MARHAETVMTITELSVYLKVPKSARYKLAQEGKVPEGLGKANHATPARTRGARK